MVVVRRVRREWRRYRELEVGKESNQERKRLNERQMSEAEMGPRERRRTREIRRERRGREGCCACGYPVSDVKLFNRL